MEEPALLTAVLLFVASSVEAGIAGVEASKMQVLASSILLMNLLIAQLNSSYVYIYQDGNEQRSGATRASVPGAIRPLFYFLQDMVGFARLNRAQKIVEAALTCFAALT